MQETVTPASANWLAAYVRALRLIVRSLIEPSDGSVATSPSRLVVGQRLQVHPVLGGASGEGNLHRVVCRRFPRHMADLARPVVHIGQQGRSRDILSGGIRARTPDHAVIGSNRAERWLRPKTPFFKLDQLRYWGHLRLYSETAELRA